MCGRFVVASAGSELVSVLRPDVYADALPAPSFNIAPTDQVTVVLDSARTNPPTRRVAAARWGLIPPWAPDMRGGAINARAETIDTKATFRGAYRSRRAVIPATGYYEWARRGDAKVPHYFRAMDGEPLLFAGLYEWFRDPACAPEDPNRWVLSATILTCASAAVPAAVHDRMPVFVDVEHAEAWMDPADQHSRTLVETVMHNARILAEELDDRVVSAAVGNVRNNSPALIEPAPDTGSTPG